MEENSGRRRFIRKLASATALAGISALILGQPASKELLPQVHANDGDPLTIGIANTGTSTTQLTSSPPQGIALDVSTADPSGGSAIRAFATATSGGTIFEGPPADPLNNTPIGPVGLEGLSNHPNGAGVRGRATSTSPGIGDNGGSNGVYGRCESPDGAGVWGDSGATTLGPDDQTSGVVGRAYATNGAAFGVTGRTTSPDGAGLKARNVADGMDLFLAGSGIAGLTPRTTDPTTRATWQLYIIATQGNNKFELRIRGPSGHVNKIIALSP